MTQILHTAMHLDIKSYFTIRNYDLQETNLNFEQLMIATKTTTTTTTTLSNERQPPSTTTPRKYSASSKQRQHETKTT